FYPDRQAAFDAVHRAQSVFRTAPIVGNVTGQIEDFALHYDFPSLDQPMPVALPQFHRTGGYGRRDNYRRSKLQYLRPVPAEWNGLIPDNLLSKIAPRLNFTKFRPDRVVTIHLLAQPFCGFWIAPGLREGFVESRIGVI